MFLTDTAYTTGQPQNAKGEVQIVGDEHVNAPETLAIIATDSPNGKQIYTDKPTTSVCLPHAASQ